jgi:hypothetical protein
MLYMVELNPLYQVSDAGSYESLVLLGYGNVSLFFLLTRFDI